MKHGHQLPLDRCPHCSVAKPVLVQQWHNVTKDFAGNGPRHWAVYQCYSCGAMVLAVAKATQNVSDIDTIWPAPVAVPDVLPPRARDFLAQAYASIHAPAGAVMLAASSVDAMLKDKTFKDGSLNARIDAAAAAHLITAEMAAWAHEIRLDANDQRHADEAAVLPGEADARKAVEFAAALAQFLYVLPARVERGRKT